MPFPRVNDSSALDRIPGEGIRACSWLARGTFSLTKQRGECEEIAHPSAAFGRQRRNWIDAHGSMPAGAWLSMRQVDAKFCTRNAPVMILTRLHFQVLSGNPATC